ncbi:hypothetical protein BGZ61DRAFT_226775 [Ilyonectria robusta]|uniref:uncharacterized protein n=1 Tax=Ilyonectria robusta TaxID=1079257 RepID=UPI001E8DD2B0|nr:uncharacterized protein BGZ61DRAFT_226775 [Ilyonectria robusta]KAH8706761.1 hypothetical protein BGZ61DRAFT_226775 [Ilyonectria robusta]
MKRGRTGAKAIVHNSSGRGRAATLENWSFCLFPCEALELVPTRAWTERIGLRTVPLGLFSSTTISQLVRRIFLLLVPGQLCNSLPPMVRWYFGQSHSTTEEFHYSSVILVQYPSIQEFHYSSGMCLPAASSPCSLPTPHSMMKNHEAVHDFSD